MVFQRGRSRYLQTRRLNCEALEDRLALAAPTQIFQDGDYFRNGAQPLNGDSSYLVRGTLKEANEQTHFAYAFSFVGGTELSIENVTLQDNGRRRGAFEISLTSPAEEELIASYSEQRSSPVLVDDTPDETGLYVLRISYGDPSINSELTYSFILTGATAPYVSVMGKREPTQLSITSEPAMPSIDLALEGIAPDPLGNTSLQWSVSVSGAKSFAPNQIVDLPTVTVEGTVNESLEFRPDFKDVVVGGFLKVDVIGWNGLTQLKASTSSWANPEDLTIIGTNPTYEQIKAYVQTKPIPSNFPKDTGVSYHQLILGIMRTETGDGPNAGTNNGTQFLFTGRPKYNVGTPGDGGHGLFQITPKAPVKTRIADVWNWKSNVEAGINKFNEKLSEAVGWIEGRAYRNDVEKLKRQLGKNTPVVAPPYTGLTTQQMILMEAVTRYNGGNKFRATTTASGPNRITIEWNLTDSPYYEKVLKSIERLPQ